MADSELIMVSERVGQLVEENKILKEQATELQRTINRVSAMRYFRSAVAVVVLAPISIGVGSVAGYPIYQSWHTPDVPTHCYVVPKTVHADMPVVYELTGSIPWHSDRDLGYHITLEQAIEAAKKMNCPLR